MSADRGDMSNSRQLDPLLRDLLVFGLVEIDPADDQWRLVETAQRRLDVLAAPPPPADKVIHFGHRCAGCHEIRPTRRRPEGFLCDACAAAAAGEQPPPLKSA